MSKNMYKSRSCTKVHKPDPFKVSVIIPTYNRPHLLERAIKSVLAQTYKGFELIIVHDGPFTSQDIHSQTEIVINKYTRDRRVRWKKLEENRGSSETRNHGFSLSRGQYIVFLDDDNEFLPDYLKETIYLLDKATPETGGVRVGRIIKHAGFDDYAEPITSTKFDSIDWGFLMRREVMQKVKYDLTMFADEDADFGIEYVKAGYKSIPLNKPLSIAHAEAEGSVCSPTARRLKGLENFIKKHVDLYKQYPDELRYLYRLAGRNFYSGGHRIKGWIYFFKSFLARKNWHTVRHLFFITLGWRVYDWFMTREEKRDSAIRFNQNVKK